MECAHIPTCPLFPLFKMKSSLSVWQDYYCRGKFEECNRYRLAHAGDRVPPNMLPNGRTLDGKPLP
jgi:hypothetical protein